MTTVDLSVVPVSVPAAAVTVMFAVPSKPTLLIVREVSSAVAVEALPVRAAVTVVADNVESQVTAPTNLEVVPTWTSVGTTFTVTDAATVYIQGAPVGSTNVTVTNGYGLWVDGGISRFDGLTWIGPTGRAVDSTFANADMTVGVTVSQGTSDDDVLAFKSSVVAHGVTTILETDTYARFRKIAPAQGGLSLTTVTEGANSLLLQVISTTENTTKTTSAGAPCEILVQLKSGTSIGAPGADANIFVVTAAGTAAFLVDKEGELFANGGAASTDMVTLFDEHDDAHLVRAFDLARTGKGLIRTAWDEHVKYNEQALVDCGVLGAPIAEGGLVCITQLQRLHNGAIWQAYVERQELLERMETLEQKLLAA